MRIFNLAEELEKERKKNKELEERIDKAIEYIETKNEKQYGFNFEYNLEETEIQDLLDILKGDNK